MKTIEKRLLDIYAEIKKEIPGLRHITFDTITYDGSGETRISCFLHIGGQCLSFDSVTEMQDYIKKTKERRSENEILYRKF